MTNITLKLNKSQVRPILARSFPSYKGRKFAIEFTTRVTFYDTNWSGGTRNQYVAINANGKVAGFSAPAPWNNPIEGMTIDLPEDVLIVEHSDFCGHDMGIRIYANPCHLPKYLPAGDSNQA